MSIQQVIHFRAIDRPLTERQLEFMQRQSSRAKSTRWEYEVEYNYSSFRGNVAEMLRNGYDIFLSYSSIGLREIRMRLPSGLPFSKRVWSQYVRAEGLQWTADKSGKAGTLCLARYLEDGYDRLWGFDDHLASIEMLRGMLIGGDLRALYVLWLCSAILAMDGDDGAMEPPVPHGLRTLPHPTADLLNLFGIDPLLVEAAASDVPNYDANESQSDLVKDWIATLSDARRRKIVERLLTEDPVALKAELCAEIRDRQPTAAWPVQPATRTVGQLQQKCDLLRRTEMKKQEKQTAAKAKREADKIQRQRRARLIEMQSDPQAWLQKASRLVKERRTDNYREAAGILADLRDAVGGEHGRKMARRQAAQLAKKYPTLNVLKSSLRKCGLLD